MRRARRPPRQRPASGVLVAAFEPFGGRKRNRALEVARRVAGDDTFVLPTEFRRLPRVLAQLLAEARARGARGLLLLGEAWGDRVVRIESVGRNAVDARIPDNAGYQPRRRALIRRAPSCYASSAPLAALARAVRGAGLTARMSRSAGRFACNAALYHALHAEARRRDPIAVGFLHVPAARGAPPLAALARGVRAALAAWAEERGPTIRARSAAAGSALATRSRDRRAPSSAAAAHGSRLHLTRRPATIRFPRARKARARRPERTGKARRR